MGRPAEWHPLHDSDPVPGDPDSVAKLGRELRKMADEIDKQAKNIKALSSVEGWDSDAGRAFHDIADGTSDRLKRSYDRYDEAATALGTKVIEGESKEYASELHRAQKIADKALTDFREAEADQKSAQQGLEKYKDPATYGGKPPTPEAIADRTRHEKKLQHSSELIRHCHSEVSRAMDIRDDAAGAAAKRIKNIIHHDGVRDPGGIMNFLADWADTFSNLSAVFSVLAVICAFIPPLEILVPLFTALAVISSALALAGHAYDMTVRGGKVDWLKLGTDALGVLPGLGALKGFKAVKGLKFLKGVRGLNKIGGIGFDAAKASEGVVTKFFNGAGVTVAKAVLKKINPVKFAEIPGEHITAVIKGVSLASAINKVLHGHTGAATGDPGDPAPPTPPGTVPPHPTPQPSPEPSPKPFHAALAH